MTKIQKGSFAAYQGVRNVSLSENFCNVINGLPQKYLWKLNNHTET